MMESETLNGARSQAAISAALLVLVLVTCISADMLARSKSLEWWSTRLSSDFAARNNTVFSYTGSFIDFEERVLLEEIPHTSYSKGGNYFFGTSNMKWAFSSWDLPPGEQEKLRNYGVGASNHKDQLEFIRYLIERHRFLQGGDRDMVVLGVSFHLAHADAPSGGYWGALLRRRGLYGVTQNGRIEVTTMNPIARWFRIEQARSSGFIWNMGRLWQAAARAYLMSPRPVVHNAAKYQAGWREFMGERWEQNMDEAMESLRQTIALVRSHGAKIQIVLLPQGGWMEGLPYGRRYDEKLRMVCTEERVPLLDLSHSMKDDDFLDSNHLTVSGQQRFRKILMNELRTGVH